MAVVAMIYRLLIMVGRDTLFYVGRWSFVYSKIEKFPLHTVAIPC